MIKFNIPFIAGTELDYINDVISSKAFQGNGKYSKKTSELLSTYSASKKVFLTSSGTQALEMAALLCNIKKDDEVIMPSFTFSSTANAFILRGAKIKFIDVDPKTMNWDENLIEDAITPKTKVLVPVHYAGVACDMDKVNKIASNNNLMVVEDAAQCILSSYKNAPLGSLSDFGIYSFHETKNIQCGEGGSIFINKEEFWDISEISVEKGTNRTKFLNGEIDKYTWVNIGSSFLMNEVTAAFLYGQLIDAKAVINKRISLWNRYHEFFENNEFVEIQEIPNYAKHNGHIFYIKLRDSNVRNKLMLFLRECGIDARTHFIPLHSSPFGKSKCEFIGLDKYTTLDSNRLLRLPLHYYLTINDVDNVTEKIEKFFKEQ